MKLRLALVSLSAGAVLAACSLVQSLDYLQDGAGPGPGPGVDGGVEAVVLATGQSAPGLLAQDDDSLYWLSGSEVNTVPKAGGTPRTIGTFAGALGLGVDPGTTGAVYVLAGSAVLTAPKAGGAVSTLATLPASTVGPQSYAVRVDATHVWILESDDTSAGRVVRLGKDGTGLVAYEHEDGTDGGAGGTPLAMAISDTEVTWFDTANDVPDLYATSKAAFPAGPFTRASLPEDTDYPENSDRIVVTATQVYWAGTNRIESRGKGATDAPIVLYRATPQVIGLRALATNGVALYAIEDFHVVRVPLTGGTGATVSSDLDEPSGLVADPAGVYLSVKGTGVDGGTIIKLPD